MKQLDRTTADARKYPEKVIQFGEGNFLRGFADAFLDVLNEKTGLNAKVVLVQPVLMSIAAAREDKAA